jgi:hypothetical protein
MKKIYEDIKKVFESKVAFRILIGIGIVIVALLIFSLGITVGFHKASFERAWGENYERNFSPKPNGPIFDPNNFPNADGAIGKIIKITLPTMIVEDKNNTEKVILIKNDTQMEEMKTPVVENNLKIDDFVVVIGSPNAQGQIEAKFIRVMPLGI